MNRWVRHHPGAVRWIAVGIVVIGIMLVMRSLPLSELEGRLSDWIEGLGFWGPLVYALIYFLATVAFIPGSILTLLAGAVFGLGIGFITVSLGSTAGAAAAFLVARYAARRKVEKVAQENRQFGAIDRAIDEGGWRIVALLRLSPAVPFNLQNYLYGLTRLRFWPYVLTSWLAMMPGTLMYVYLGHVAGTAALGGDRTVGEWIFLIVGLLATIAVTVYITRLARQKLREQTEITEAAKPTDEGADTGPAQEKVAGAEPPKSQEELSEEELEAQTVRSYTIITFALIFFALSLILFVNADAMNDWVRTRVFNAPPRVEMREAYASEDHGLSAGSSLVDHSAWERVLNRYVEPGGWVDYEALKANPRDLDTYLNELELVRFKRLNRDQKLALLINAYNAFTVKLIVENYPINSIRDIPSAERWNDVRWEIGSETWSLNQIEHEQIRPKFAEPRIHFALVCAAVGCPPLATRPYTAERLEQQLRSQANYVHHHETWLQFDADDDLLKVTPLYKWYRHDFEQFADSIVDYVARHSTPVKKAVDSGSDLEVDFLEYDWKLNSVENQQPR